MRSVLKASSVFAATGIAGLLSRPVLAADTAQVAAVKVGAADIGGVVSGPSGPEAGVWVIAQTEELDDHREQH